MLGIPEPKPAAPASETAVSTTPPAAVDQVPPIPSALSAPGPAAVAAGTSATPEKGREMRIIGDTTTPVGTPATAARGTAPGVTVGGPEPAANGSTSNLVPVPVGGGANAPIPVSSITPTAGHANLTFEQAEQALKQYGVNWQRLWQEFPGQWKFECSAPISASAHRYYVITAADPLSAISAVLSRIEADRSGATVKP